MIKKEDGVEYEVIEAEKKSELNLVFIHGTGCNKTFLRSLAVLFKEYNCYLVDLPGHGNSDNTGYNFNNYVRAINNLVEKIPNVILIGHSLGGTIALKEAASGSRSVIGEVIISSAARWRKLDKGLMKKIRNGMLDIDYIMKAAGHIDNEDVMESLKTMEPAGNTMADFFIDEAVDIKECLDEIKIPTLIIDGEDDILALTEYSEILHNNISNSKLIMIPGGRHMVCVAEKNKFKKLICNFIEEDVLKIKEKIIL